MSGGTMMQSALESVGMARAESMEISNDPRFFTDNVINYRLAAFASTGIVSGLLIGQAMSDMMGMDKNMNLTKPMGIIQFVNFFILCWILFFNTIATYVSVAQPYHCYRLLTSGPTGFECSASYYLNPNIATWRHFAIKMLLISLPLYIIQMGLRIVVKFDRANKKDPEFGDDAPAYSDLQGIGFGCFLAAFGVVLYCVHQTHFSVFRERYASMSTPAALQTYVATMANPRMQTTVNTKYDRHLDV